MAAWMADALSVIKMNYTAKVERTLYPHCVA